MFNLWLDYPTFDQEVEVVRQTTSANKPQLNHIMSAADIHRYQHLVRQIPVADNVIEYAVKLVGQTRPDGDLAPQFIKDYLSYGAGPRASQYLILGAKATAALDGRLTPDIKDVHKIAVPVLRHRIVTNFSAEADGISSVNIIERLLASDE
jgi:MoxR-like ATPase